MPARGADARCAPKRPPRLAPAELLGGRGLLAPRALPARELAADPADAQEVRPVGGTHAGGWH